MWDDIDFGELFGGGTPNFNELPMMEMPNFGEMELLDPTMLGGFGDLYEEGYLGGDSDGSNGSPTNPGSSNFDWTQLLKLAGGAAGGAAGGGSSGGGIGDLLKSLGLTGGAGGSGSLLPLLGLIASIGGGVNASNATKEATAQLQAGADKANQQATELIGGARNDFQPYMQAGQGALSKLEAMIGNSGLASKFATPVGGLKAPTAISSRGMSPMQGAMTLAQLVARK